MKAEEVRAVRLWAGVAIPPLAALTGISFLPALVHAACAGRPAAALHAALVVLVAVAATGILLAWRNRQRGGAVGGLLGTVGLAVGVLSTLVLLGMWAAVVVLEPCQRY